MAALRVSAHTQGDPERQHRARSTDHEGAFPGQEGAETSASLRRLGAIELFRNDTDVLLLLPR